MAICPTCKNEVTTPSFLNLSAWRSLVCPHCKARLEMKPPRSFLLAPVMAPLFVLARHRPAIAIIAFVYMFATFFLILLESLRPKVQLRKKPLPEPSIRLNIDGPPNQ
jgi:DNA-directed RNA polymerase subunit RPC12/RpoP